MFRIRLVLVLPLSVLAAACSSTPNVPYQPGGSSSLASASTPPAAIVTLANVSFAPAVVTINAGQTVEWVWNDAPIPHNVTFATFRSPTKITGTFFHTFDVPGTYRYRCTIHATMFGTVIVH